jgi:hypothetical protein
MVRDGAAGRENSSATELFGVGSIAVHFARASVADGP